MDGAGRHAWAASVVINRQRGYAMNETQACAAAPDIRSCTCHPDDNPPLPCPRKFSLTECRQAATVFGLGEIAANLRYWTSWNKRDRAKENLTTDENTSIMCVPPHWPSHGQITLWAETIELAAALLRGERGAELPRPDVSPRGS